MYSKVPAAMPPVRTYVIPLSHIEAEHKTVHELSGIWSAPLSSVTSAQLYQGNTGPISILSRVLFHWKLLIPSCTSLFESGREHLISPSLTLPGCPTSVPGSGRGTHSSCGIVAFACAVNVILNNAGQLLLFHFHQLRQG